jgi:uncharacterized membrane protein YbaN (DUF454 family)
MIRVLLIILGTLFLGLGVIGVVVPGLPTTPFVLLAAALYLRSSDRLYNRLLNHRIFGRIVRSFRETKSISLRGKIISISTMWGMILLSIALFIDQLVIRLIVTVLGVIGTIVLLLIPTTSR